MSASVPSDDPGLAERLRAARENAGMTQEQAADRLGMARTTLVAIEKGQRRVRPEELSGFAETYDVSFNALLRPTSVVVELAPRFRALGSVAQDRAAADATRLLNDLVAAEIELERMLGRTLRRDYPPERPILPGDVRPQAEDIAMEVRGRLGLGLSPVTDVVNLLDLELGCRVFVHPFSGSISGLFVYDDEVGACILLNRNHPPKRRALTAAHELGHLVSARREPDIFDLEKAPRSREERFARAFALAFMMPAAGLRRRFHDILQEAGRFSPSHLVLLALAYNVTEEPLCRRLEELDLLPGGTWESLKERKFSARSVRQALGEPLREPELLLPPRLWLLAAEAHRRELLSEGQLSRMLHMDRVEVRKLLDSLDSEGVDDLRSVAAE